MKMVLLLVMKLSDLKVFLIQDHSIEQCTREFEESNYRVNIDYSPTDNALWYLSVTTGHRAGGFNLGYFSAFPSYDSEEVTSYELVIKDHIWITLSK